MGYYFMDYSTWFQRIFDDNYYNENNNSVNNILYKQYSICINNILKFTFNVFFINIFGISETKILYLKIFLSLLPNTILVHLITGTNYSWFFSSIIKLKKV